MPTAVADNEKSKGIYSWLASPMIYDAWQGLVRSHRSRASFFSQRVRPRAGMRVLDVGCGTGDALRYLGNVNYLGIDRSLPYIEAARARTGRADCFLVGDVSSISELNVGQFDVVFCLGVLHHLDDETAIAMLTQIGSMLAPNGRFVSHDPVLIPNQGCVARFFVSNDRGRHVRTLAEIQTLAGECFSTVRADVDSRSLRIPFTEVILECSGSRSEQGPGPAAQSDGPAQSEFWEGPAVNDPAAEVIASPPTA